MTQYINYNNSPPQNISIDIYIYGRKKKYYKLVTIYLSRKFPHDFNSPKRKIVSLPHRHYLHIFLFSLKFISSFMSSILKMKWLKKFYISLFLQAEVYFIWCHVLYTQILLTFRVNYMFNVLFSLLKFYFFLSVMCMLLCECCRSLISTSKIIFFIFKIWFLTVDATI